MSSIVRRLYQLLAVLTPIPLELQESMDLRRCPSTNCRHTFLTHGATLLDISGRPARTTTQAWLRSWKAMDTRTARVNHHRRCERPALRSADVQFRPRPPARQGLRGDAHPGVGPWNRAGRQADDHRVDSTIYPVHEDHKQGAAFGYTHVLGYSPVLATRAETGEVVHVRFRPESAGSGRGAERFVESSSGACDERDRPARSHFVPTQAFNPAMP